MSYDTTMISLAELRNYWKFNETSGLVANDSKGTDHLTITAGVTLNQPSINADNTKSALFGTNGAAWFTGVDFDNFHWTLEMWFRTNDFTQPHQVLFGVSIGEGAEGWDIRLNGSSSTDGRLYLHKRAVSWVDLGVVVPDNNTHHFAFVKYNAGDGTPLMRWYLDGVSIAETFSQYQSGSQANFFIGAENTGGGSNFNGRIQQVSITNGVVQPETIAEHFNAPSGSADDEARMNTFKTTIYDRHNSGAQPYTIRYAEGTTDLQAAPSAQEHYDPACCFFNAEAFCKFFDMTPDDWSTEISNAIIMWRDGWVRALRSQGYTTVAGYHHHTHGLALDYLVNGSTLSRTTLREMIPEEWGHAGTAQSYKDNFGWNYWGREQAFRLMGSCDLKNCGFGDHTMVHTEAEICLWHNEGFLGNNPNERYGRYVRPWMQGLAMRSLVYYWFTYRDSTDPAVIAIRDQIPPMCEAFVTWCMNNAWYPPGSNVPIAFEGAYWNYGTFAYQMPGGQAPGFTHITDLTVQSVEEPNRLFTGPASLSSIDNYYRHLSIICGGGQSWIKNYNGTTKQFEIYYNAISNPEAQVNTPGQTFHIWTLGDDGVGGNAPSGGMPVANTIVSPIASFCYWHRRFIMNDDAGATQFRVWHQEIWDGQKMAWGTAYTQKEYNETMLWGPLGIGFRDAGDADQDTQYESLGITYADPDTPVTLYELAIDGPHTGQVGSPSGNITVSLGLGTVASPITVTFGVTGATGTFSSNTVVLDETTRTASVTFTPTSVGDATISVSDDGGLTDPSPIVYTAFEENTGVSSYTFVNQGASSGAVGLPTGTLRIELGQGNVDGLVTFTFSVSGVTGTFLNTTRNLNNTFRWGETTFTPTSVGNAVISVTNNGGLNNPGPIFYTVTQDVPAPPITPVQETGDTKVAVIMRGDRVSWIIPWDGKL